MSHRSDMSAPSILDLIELVKDYYQEGALYCRLHGTGPDAHVYEAWRFLWRLFDLAMPTADHYGDENVKIADYYTQ